MLPGGTGTMNLTARRGKSACAAAANGTAAVQSCEQGKAPSGPCEAIHALPPRAVLSRPYGPFCNGAAPLSWAGNRVPGPCGSPLKPAICAPPGDRPKTVRKAVSKEPSRDRSLHLDHPQRPQGLHRARGVRAALHRASGGHRQGRAVQAGVPQDQPQQPHSGDRRSRQRHGADGVGRDPDLPRRQDRQVPAARGRRRATA